MKALLDVAGAVLVLVVLVWAAIFGGLGAVLAASRGGKKGEGFLWGVFLGPVGWLITMVRTRGGARPFSGRTTPGEEVGAGDDAGGVYPDY